MEKVRYLVKLHVNICWSSEVLLYFNQNKYKKNFSQTPFKQLKKNYKSMYTNEMLSCMLSKSFNAEYNVYDHSFSNQNSIAIRTS